MWLANLTDLFYEIPLYVCLFHHFPTTSYSHGKSPTTPSPMEYPGLSPTSMEYSNFCVASWLTDLCYEIWSACIPLPPFSNHPLHPWNIQTFVGPADLLICFKRSDLYVCLFHHSPTILYTHGISKLLCTQLTYWSILWDLMGIIICPFHQSPAITTPSTEYPNFCVATWLYWSILWGLMGIILYPFHKSPAIPTPPMEYPNLCVASLTSLIYLMRSDGNHDQSQRDSC